MSDYGIEIYNSLGELVFASDRRTVQILKIGTISVPWGRTSASIEFPPVVERPQIMAQIQGLYPEWRESIRTYDPSRGWGYMIRRWEMIPYIGSFLKNDEGKYYRVRIGAVTGWLQSETPWAQYEASNPGYMLTDIPCVIFL